MRHSVLVPLSGLLACCLAPGCGGKDRVEISGKVTFDGKPLPAGRIYFTPDSSKGNEGPQGFAAIENGQFDTRKNGMGAPGGPTIVSIQGYEATGEPTRPQGKKLFEEHQIAIDLPRQSSTQNFEVPASAAEKLREGPAPDWEKRRLPEP